MKNQFNFPRAAILEKGTKARFGIEKVVWYNDAEEERKKEKGVLDKITPVIPSGTVSAHLYFFFVNGWVSLLFS
jgi:hypothetical protein